MSIVLDGTNGIDSSDLNITGSAARISADFSNGTFANRTMFQSNVTDGVSVVSVIPNGTSDTASFRALNNSDPTNASYIQLLCNSSVARFETSITGTGTYLPMSFFTNATERLRITVNGGISVGNTGSAVGTSGQVLTSNGDAPPSWQAASSIGVGQTWQDVTASRSSGTTYTNSTGKPIFVVATTGNAQNAQMTVVVSGITIFDRRVQFEPSRIGGEFIVPADATYSATSASGFDKWVELR